MLALVAAPAPRLNVSTSGGLSGSLATLVIVKGVPTGFVRLAVAASGGKQTRDLHCKTVARRLAPFLDRPQRHIVAWIQTGKGIVPPTMGVRPVGWVIG